MFTLPFFRFLPEDIGYLPAKMVATVVVLFWNFFVNRFWTYGNVEYMVHPPMTSEVEDLPAGDAPPVSLHQ